jgi:hypothetical protein
MRDESLSISAVSDSTACTKTLGTFSLFPINVPIKMLAATGHRAKVRAKKAAA